MNKTIDLLTIKYLKKLIRDEDYYLKRTDQMDVDKIKREWYNKGYLEGRKNAHIPARELGLPKSWDFQQEQPEIGLEEFTQKMNDWKARYVHPDIIPIKATMAFTARMFYMYPDIARQWYDSLPKVTQD